MSWYWWTLIYVAGWMLTFRIIYLRNVEATQRAVARDRHKELAKQHGPNAEYYVRGWKADDLAYSYLAAVGWPIVLTFLVGKFIMFPRGIRTKFDREQQLEREKKEAEVNYQKARELLAQEGIKVD